MFITDVLAYLDSCGLMEASNYSAKLNSFLDGYDPDVVKWVKNVLNGIFLGIKADFDGYREGKRPTIKEYGTYKIYKMVIQAESDVKVGSDDRQGKWNFHYPIKDYCSKFGKIFEKKIDGDSYQCVAYNHKEDLSDSNARRLSWSEYEDLTSQAVYPMVGCYCTGTGGSYKNLTKEIPGNTYSIIVSVPMMEGSKQTFTNPFMTHRGQVYTFTNNHHSKESGKDTFTVEYDMSSGSFTIREYEEGSYDTFTLIYKGRGHMKAFKELVDSFNGDSSVSWCEQVLTANGLRCKNSWWFNPYYD